MGGDQRAVDFNLKDRLQYANQQTSDFELVEDNYPDFFKALATSSDLPTYQASSLIRQHRKFIAAFIHREQI